jgi:mannose-1-phosphate guanylyltransferase/mannose-6-phosphate isomerase
LVALGKIAAEAAPTSTERSRGSGFSRDHDPILLILPADHVILDVAAFATAVTAALEAAAGGRLVTFGIVPSRPETGYGYLRVGKAHGAWAELDRFVEKPDAEAARRYVDSGEYLWNSGMFVFRARAYLEELERLAPAMLETCRAAVAAAEAGSDFTRLGAAFLESPTDSIDYAVMEKTHAAAVVPLAAGWSDIGSWAALHEVLEKDDLGNAFRGDVIAEACTNTCVVASERLVAAVGLEGVVVVETADAVLVTAADQAQRVKAIVDALKGTRRAETREPTAGSAATPPARET